MKNISSLDVAYTIVIQQMPILLHYMFYLLYFGTISAKYYPINKTIK